MPEPGRANPIPRKAADKPNKGKEAVRRIGVGLIRSRGVTLVMRRKRG